MGYNGYTDKKKASNKRYLEKLVQISFRVKPEEKKELEQCAADNGVSVNQYIKNKCLN